MGDGNLTSGEVQSPTSRWGLWAGLTLLFASAFAAYAALPTAYYTYDAISYAQQIRTFIESGDARHLFHPHHLLFNGLGALTWWMLNSIGVAVDPLRALQGMNAFFAAVGLTLLAWLGVRGGLLPIRASALPQRAHPLLVMAFSVLLGSAYGYWACATDGRVNMPALVSFIATLGMALSLLHQPSLFKVLMLSLLGVLTVALHQSYGLLIVGGTTAIWLTRGLSRQQRLGWTVLFWLTFGLGTLALYLVVGIGIRGIRTFEQFHQWMFAYAHDGRWWDWNIGRNLLLDVKALLRVFIGATSSGSARALLLLFALGAPLAVLVPLRWGVHQLAQRDTEDDTWRVFVLLFFTALPFAAFFTVWNPGYFVFWMPVAVVLVLWWLFLSAQTGMRARLAISIGVLLVAAWLLKTNLETTLLSRTVRQNNPYLRLCDQLTRHARAGDLLLSSGFGALAPLETYAPYFARLRVVSLNIEFKRAKGDAQAATAAIRKQIEQAWQRNRRVLVLDEFESATAKRELKKRYGTPPEAIDAVLHGYQRQLLFTSASTQVFLLQPMDRVHGSGSSRSKRALVPRRILRAHSESLPLRGAL
ncbi:MAG: hypothetical protein ABDI19_02825 [Armatimonadota bacterium]